MFRPACLLLLFAVTLGGVAPAYGLGPGSEVPASGAGPGGAAPTYGSGIGQPEFFPVRFLPGQTVTLLARIETGGADFGAEAMSGGFPDSGASGPVIVSAVIEKRREGPFLVIKFVPWKAGPGFLPAFSLGGFSVPRLRFECDSALAEGDLSAPEPLPQLEYPGLYARIYVAAGLALVALVGLLGFAGKALPWLRTLKARRAFSKARKDFDELLDRLGGRDSAADDTAAWAELCSGARRFAGLRAGSELEALTASELAALPPDLVPGGARDGLALLVAAGDSARFAGLRGLGLDEWLRAARQMAESIDEACAAGAGRETRRGAGKRRPAGSVSP